MNAALPKDIREVVGEFLGNLANMERSLILPEKVWFFFEKKYSFFSSLRSVQEFSGPTGTMCPVACMGFRTAVRTAGW